MKITLNKSEMMNLFKTHFPPNLIPGNYEVTGVKEEGYPIRGFEITMEEKEEADASTD